MCMKPIPSVDAPFRHYPDVIQFQPAPYIVTCEVEGRTQVYSQDGLDMNAFFKTLKYAGVWS